MSTNTTTSVVAWHELYTSDVETAVGFYAQLLGGTQTAMNDYTMLEANGRGQAGFYPKDSDHDHVPAHWYPYFSVADVDASVAHAKELGADLFHGPMTIEGMLRYAVLGDPQRATFGVMQPLMESDEGPPTEIVAWDELTAPDADAATSFYSELFGWTTEPFGGMDYSILKAGEHIVGGLMKKPEDQPSEFAFWTVYFATDDVDDTAKRAQELGATVLMPPTSMENVGRFAILSDPTGAAFGIHTGGQ
jgi:predicted enzyme related to lactoylglutathione lyase